VSEAEAPAEAWRSIECRSAERTIRLPAGVRLDLGGLGKGSAAKVVVVSGAEAGLAWLEARPHLAGLICVEHSPEPVVTSRRLTRYLWC
jgi:hypothetical protein